MQESLRSDRATLATGAYAPIPSTSLATPASPSINSPALDRSAAEGLALRIADLLAEPFPETGEGLEARVGISLRRGEGDAFAVWTEALRAADVDAVRLDLPFVIIGESLQP